MKIYSVILFLFISINTFCNYPISDIPKNLLLKANQVIRKDITKITIQNRSIGVEHVERVISYLKTEKNNYIQIYYSPGEKVSKIKVIFYDEFGKKIRSLKTKDIPDALVSSSSITNQRYKYIDLSHAKSPYTVSYSYTKTIKGRDITFLSGQYFQNSYNQSVQHFDFSITLPSNIEVLHRTRNINKSPIITTKSDVVKYQWFADNLEAIKFEQYGPSSTYILPHIELSLSEFKFDNHYGSWRSWEHFGQFLYNLHKGTNELPNELKIKIKSLIENEKSDRKKIEILYNYLQENFRYVSIQLGIGGWQPIKASKVYKTKYGDCKGLSNLMFSMLQEVGIKSNQAIIQSKKYKFINIDPDFAHNYFNHEILYIPSEDIWLDCTYNYGPFDYIHSSNSGRYALLLENKASKLKMTTILNEKTNIISSTTKIGRLNNQLTFNSHIKLTGEPHEIFRYFNEMTSNKKNDVIANFVNTSISNTTKFEIDVDKDGPNANIDLDFKKDIKGTKDSYILNLIPIFEKEKIPKKYKNRKFNLEISKARTTIDTFIFDLDFKENIELPENVEYKSKFGEYILKFSIEKKCLKVIRYKISRSFKGTPEDYLLYRKYIKKVKSFDNKSIYIDNTIINTN